MEATIDPIELRNALGAFITGVTVITTHENNGTPRGFTANSFTSVSLDPPLILACVANTASSYPIFSAQSHFAVNILSESQKDISGVFASKRADKFEQVSWYQKTTGSPILEEAVSVLDCTVHERIPAGDHLILIGRVVDFDYNADIPLAFCRGTYLDYALGQSVLPDPGQSIYVGGIVEKEGQVLFVRDSETGKLRLPVSSRLGRTEKSQGLISKLKKYGVEAELGFIYSVFDDESDNQMVYYRGHVARELGLSPQIEWVALDEIPWGRIEDETVRSMMERYVTERKTLAKFGVYVGTSEMGQVQHLAS